MRRVAELLDRAPRDEARAMLFRCCGSSRWADAMADRRPFGDDAALYAIADEEWSCASRDEVMEALSHHPRIGASMDELRKKYASTASWSAGEQSGASAASEATLRALAEANTRYEAKFGHVFVVCATGKTAEEMLAILGTRMHNDPDTECTVAREEQRKITKIRLEKLGAS